MVFVDGASKESYRVHRPHPTPHTHPEHLYFWKKPEIPLVGSLSTKINTETFHPGQVSPSSLDIIVVVENNTLVFFWTGCLLFESEQARDPIALSPQLQHLQQGVK